MPRLAEVLRLKGAGALLSSMRGGMLFAKGTGLRKYQASHKTEGALYYAIVGRCRRELRRAGRELRDQRRGKDADLYANARALSQSSADAITRMQRAWRAIREDRASAALENVWT